MKLSLFFLTVVLIIGIVFSSSLLIDGINANVVKPKFPVMKKALPVKSFQPVADCAGEGRPSGILNCCKDLVAINGICKKVAVSTRSALKSFTRACAGENQRIDVGQKCCDGFEPVNFICKRKPPFGIRVPAPAPSIPNPLGQCGTFDNPPTLVGCCDDLINRNGKCVYPYDCARHGERASDHNNKCCGGEVPNSNGICSLSRCGEIWQRARDYDGPNSGCCLGYAPDANGVCKTMGCASDGNVAVHFARGCCRGLEPDSGLCKPPCAKENERESSKPGGCCHMLVADDRGICHPVEITPPNPTAGFPSPY